MPRRLLVLLLSLLLVACAPQVAVQNARGNELYADGSFDQALSAYQRAQVDAPERPEPHYNAANAHNRLDDLVSVAEETRLTLKEGSNDLKAEAWYNLGNAYLDAELFSEAIAAYQESLRLNPSDLDAKHNLELAQRELQSQEEHPEQEPPPDEQQDHSQQGQEDADQEQGDQGGQGSQGEQNEQPEDQQPPQGQSGPSDEGEPTPQPEGSPAQPPPMTAEQARSLLQALLGESQTLQEHLQERQEGWSGQPDQDW